MNILKKSLLGSFTIAVVLVTTLVLGSSYKAEAANPKSWPGAVVIASGPIGGAWYGLSAGFADMITKHLDVSSSAEVTAASGANINLLASGEAHMGCITSDAAHTAFFAQGLYKGKARQSHFRTLFTGLGASVHFVTLKKSGIKTFDDIRGKRFICHWPVSSIATNMVNAVLEAYGIGKGDYRRMVFSNFKETCNSLRERRADVGIVATAAGTANSAVIELEATHPIRILSVDPDKLDKICEKYPFIGRFKQRGGTYTTLKEEVNLMVIYGGWYAREDMPDTLTYKITKLIMENPAEVASYHRAGKAIVLKRAFRGAVVPYHEGAIKYYKEKGVWTDKMAEKQERLLETIK